MPGAPGPGRRRRPGAPARSRRPPRAGRAGSPSRPCQRDVHHLVARRPRPGPPRRPGPRRTRTPRPGNAAPCSSGSAHQARCDPGAPGCLPGLRPPPRLGFGPAAACGRAGHRPTAASRSCRCCGPAGAADPGPPPPAPPRRPAAPRSPRLLLQHPACSAITASRAAHDAQPGAGGGRTAITGHHHRRPSVINTTRWVDSQKITTSRASDIQPVRAEPTGAT